MALPAASWCSCQSRIKIGVAMRDEEFALQSLEQSALFAHCEPAGLHVLAAAMVRRRFRRNEVIFHQGDPGDALHIVASGAVKIILPSPEGDEAIIATLQTGDFFGELALLDGAPHSASATAVEPVETMSLARVPFQNLIEADRGLRTALLSGLAAELRRLTSQVEELHFLDLAGRLAMRLVRLARDRDPSANGEVHLDWPFTQSDLASMIGGTRQSVNKLLSQLVQDGLLLIEHDTLVIHDLQALEERAER